MTATATDAATDATADADRRPDLLAGYGGGDELAPGRYLPLAAAYAAGVGAFAAWFVRSGRRLPDRPAPWDVALLGVATFRLSRLVARDKVTSFLRAPFTRFEATAPSAEVNERPRGEGVRRTVGELATCPFCAGQWAATALGALFVAEPPLGRAVSAVLTAVAVSDGLQYVETALQQRVG